MTVAGSELRTKGVVRTCIVTKITSDERTHDLTQIAAYVVTLPLPVRAGEMAVPGKN